MYSFPTAGPSAVAFPNIGLVAMSVPRKIRPTAFSLLELIAVVVILGIIATLILPRASAARNEAAEKACYHNRMLINSAVERYAVSTGSNPPDLDALANDPDYFPQGIPVCPVSGSAYTLNPATQRVVGHSGGVHP
jgi:prepilin-type N-terminal cleavage/methylation domain-containing protein